MIVCLPEGMKKNMMKLGTQSQESFGLFREAPKVKKLLFVEAYSRNKVSVLQSAVH